MFVQTEVTPNPNSLKVFAWQRLFLIMGSFEVTKKEEVDNELSKESFVNKWGNWHIFRGRIFYLSIKNKK